MTGGRKGEYEGGEAVFPGDGIPGAIRQYAMGIKEAEAR